MALRPFSFDSPMVPFSDSRSRRDMWNPQSMNRFGGGQVWDPAMWPTTSMARKQEQILHNAHMDQYCPLLSADLIESPTDFHVHCDLPGVEPADLDITINENSVVIAAERREVHREETDVARRVERNYGKIRRELFLPRNCNTASATAKFEHGVLQITFPKSAETMASTRKLSLT